MIKYVTITNPSGEKIRLELANPDESGLIIKSITGLGPTKATINSVTLANADGSVYTSAKAESRNIVMELMMLDSPTIEDARQKTYKYFPLKKKINIQIETDNRIAETFGYVESNEPDIFSNEESTQISIICPDPYFYELGGSSFGFYGTHPMFEFPFSNESLTDNLIEFGDIRNDTRLTINYIGDADTGVLITVHAFGPANDITLYNFNTRETMYLNTSKIKSITGSEFSTGDDIVISTMKGSKYVKLLRDGKETNLISIINKDADWFQLENGNNEFGFSAIEGERNLQVVFEYKNAYGGI